MVGQLKVIKPGFYTTVQDKGRFGFRKYGVPVSGAMDSKAMEAANSIVGNAIGNPVLECTFDGGEYEFQSSAIIAVTGAESDVQVNNKTVKRYKELEIEKGDLLKIGHPKRGCRTYLAIQGTWNLKKIMGSFSTYVPGNFGGLAGSILKAGDFLEWESNLTEPAKGLNSELEIPYWSGKLTIDVFPGPEWDKLNTEQKQQLLETEYKVKSTSNRMAIRFTGTEIAANILDMKSSAVAPGIIQLPPSGIPIVLMKDAQTIGGYPRILNVASYHLWRLGQLVTDNLVRFKLKS